uniref:Uncharacterized protein n=1 Tax=Curvibacter symbiont subsp. Hydra magnipapillata TaxID=667019 RepID=C9YBC6_CURXX|nr:hypothetical protein Csp_A14270 [Curvibacter putative symbiont of Hydra magnipapillata]
MDRQSQTADLAVLAYFAGLARFEQGFHVIAALAHWGGADASFISPLSCCSAIAAISMGQGILGTPKPAYPARGIARLSSIRSKKRTVRTL